VPHSYSTPTLLFYCTDACRSRALPCAAMPEGRQIARVTCHACHRTVEIDPLELRGLRGPRLYRALRCTRCGARDAEVSIRWEAPPAAKR
jgi:hypothetical protein